MVRKKELLSGVLTLVLLVGFPLVLRAQAPPETTARARALALNQLLNSTQGVKTESARVHVTREGYLRFVMAPPGTFFPVAQTGNGTAQDIANSFLEQWFDLLVNRSQSLRFNVVRVMSKGPRTYLRYRETYADLEVFHASITVQVNSPSGVVAVLSDVMRDTQVLDSRAVSLAPAVDAANAQAAAINWLGGQYPEIQLNATPGTLMVFCPEVVGSTGNPRLVWRVIVGSSETASVSVKELMLVDAHTKEVAFHYSLISTARDRRVYDYEGRTYNPILRRYEGQTQPYGVDDVDRAYDYLGDAYEFYSDHHQRDSYDDGGSLLIAYVRWTGYPPCYWDGSSMRIDPGGVTDDTVGHELTHGVTESTSGLAHSGESGAINESFSDMWGEWIDQTYDHPTGDPNEDDDSSGVQWYLFEDWDPTPWRQMDDPTACYTDSSYGTDFGSVPQPDRYDSHYYYRQGSPSFPVFNNQDDGGVHHNLGVSNKLGYLLTQTQGVTFNGQAISGLGISTAADLFYECQEHLLQSDSDYYDLGNLLQLAAVNLGLSTQQRGNVEKACRAVEIYTAQVLFEVRASSGTPVAWFDDAGNLFLTGTLTQYTSPGTPGTGDFALRTYGSSNYPAIIFGSTGDMRIQGGLYEQQTSLSPPAWSFWVWGSIGAVAYIDTSGNVYLKGRLYQRQ